MRHRTFDTGKNSPFFRPPKYTGITLSLLSIFVLVSMLAVWEKMVQTPNLPNLRILAWDSAKLPLERIRKVYQQEAQCIVTIQYQNQSEILESIISKNISTDSTWDVLILPASQDFDELLDLDDWSNRGVIAYGKEKFEPSKEVVEGNQSSQLLAFVKKSSDKNTFGYSFIRYLQAPMKGQVEFAIDGWTGVDQDHWDQSPRLKIYAIRESKPWLNHVAEDFAQREGLALDISFLEKDHLEASVRLLSQANHKDYLPDLVSLPAEDNPPEWVGDFYLKFEQAPIDGLPMCCIYIRKKSPLFKTSQRFLHYLSKTK
jgi:hypothetical protein